MEGTGFLLQCSGEAPERFDLALGDPTCCEWKLLHEKANVVGEDRKSLVHFRDDIISGQLVGSGSRWEIWLIPTLVHPLALVSSTDGGREVPKQR